MGGYVFFSNCCYFTVQDMDWGFGQQLWALSRLRRDKEWWQCLSHVRILILKHKGSCIRFPFKDQTIWHLFLRFERKLPTTEWLRLFGQFIFPCQSRAKMALLTPFVGFKFCLVMVVGLKNSSHTHKHFEQYIYQD